MPRQIGKRRGGLYLAYTLAKEGRPRPLEKPLDLFARNVPGAWAAIEFAVLALWMRETIPRKRFNAYTVLDPVAPTRSAHSTLLGAANRLAQMSPWYWESPGELMCRGCFDGARRNSSRPLEEFSEEGKTLNYCRSCIGKRGRRNKRKREQARSRY